MIGMVKRRRVSRGGKAAPVLTGTANVFNTSTATGSIIVPGTTKVGDLILLAIFSGAGAPTTPTGYSLVASSTITPTGSFLGLRITLFSKTAVLGDIGATVNLSGMDTSFPNSFQIRSYTSGGVDQTASNTIAVSSGTASLAVPSLTTSQTNETLVAFMAGSSQVTTPHESLAAGGSNVLGGANTNHFSYGASQDWTLANAGSTSTGGGISDSSDTPMDLAGLSVTLKGA